MNFFLLLNKTIFGRIWVTKQLIDSKVDIDFQKILWNSIWPINSSVKDILKNIFFSKFIQVLISIKYLLILTT